MPHYCTKCQINWSALETQDDQEGDEQYEFCPTCKTDTFLVDGKPGDAFCIGSTGVINMRTKQPLCIPVAPLPAKFKDETDFNWDAWERKQYENMMQQERAIAAYHEVYEQDEEEAKKRYFETFK